MSKSTHTPGPATLNEYLMAFRDHEGFGFPEGKGGYRSTFPLAKRIVCADGFSLSVQATHGAYCSLAKTSGLGGRLRLASRAQSPALIMEYAEDASRPTETVYGYVPIELVEQLIQLHGGADFAAILKAEGKQ